MRGRPSKRLRAAAAGLALATTAAATSAAAARPAAVKASSSVAASAPAAVVATATANTTAPMALSVVDDSGQRLTLARPARRVVTLAPNLAELVFAAGGGDRLVGVMRYSEHPSAVARLPVVGDAFTVNLEKLAALQPDLLLVWTSGVNPRQQQRLHSLGAPVYHSEINSIATLADTLRRIGRLLGTDAVAEAQAAALLARWQALQARWSTRAPVRVFYQLWDEPLMTVNRQHLIAQALRACGGVNAFDDLPPLTPTIGWEAVLATDPQVVVTGHADNEPARLQRWQRYPQLSAVRHGLLIALDGQQLARMSPAFIDGAEALCQAVDRARR